MTIYSFQGDSTQARGVAESFKTFIGKFIMLKWYFWKGYAVRLFESFNNLDKTLLCKKLWLWFSELPALTSCDIELEV